MRSASYLLAVFLSGVTMALGAATISPVTNASTPDPERYSSCAIVDQGYQLQYALQASDSIVMNKIRGTGLFLATNWCHYQVLNATIAGVCNGAARNRTVNADEVKRGFAQLFKDCKQDSGYHLVNNITFSAYGLIGGTKALVPKEFAYPDFPGWSDEPEVIPVRK